MPPASPLRTRAGSHWRLGLPLGLAFQLADDLLDVIGSSRNTGKPVGGDIREGKRTVLLADAIEAAGDVERRELIDMWEAESRDEAHVRRAIALFESTGAIARSKERIAGLWLESKAAIETLELSQDRKDTLTEAWRTFRTDCAGTGLMPPHCERPVFIALPQPFLVDYK